MPTQTERTEYRIRVKKKNLEIFVPNAFQTDVSEAVKVYNREKNSLMNKTEGNVVTIEKHIIDTKVIDYSETADKLLK